MALQGTIKDFGLGDIFQLIGIQRKTGILTLENDEESVMIKFIDGQVVGADTKQRSVEDLLGAVLVRQGRISEPQLHEALRVQRRTLQRLGHVLVKHKMVSSDDLVDALRVQSLQIIYRLFRWRAGSYHFDRADSLEYDEQHFVPISAETILMEGARMIDEWPIIERRIKSDRLIFRPTPEAAGLHASVEAIVDRDIDAELSNALDGVRAAPKKADKPALSEEEVEVLGLVDGKRTVAEISDRCTLGEFDTCRILADFVTRKLLEQVKKGNATGMVVLPESRWLDRGMRWTLHLLVAGLIAAGLGTLSVNPFVPWRLAGEPEALDDLRRFASHSRLEELERAIQVFYLDAGSFPDALERLAQGGYVRALDLVDPWGREYGYRLGAGGFQLFGHDAEGEPSPELSLSRRFSPLQRMMNQPPVIPASSE